MKKLTILTLTLLLTALAQLTTQPVQAEVSIPDDELAGKIRDTLGLPSGAAITAQAMRKLTSLNAMSHRITDITGLEHATNLTELFLRGTGVSDVSPLSGLTQLTRLGLGNTDVSDISPLSGLTQLTSLYLSDTAVSDISPLSGLTQLEKLSLEGTDVSDISLLSGLTQLTELDLRTDDVSDISPLSGLTQLEKLSLGGTAVSDVSPLANLTRLYWLDLHHTDVSDVSPLANLELSWLILAHCNLSYASIHTHIPALQATNIDMLSDNVAYPALLKVAGDRQEGAPGATLKTPFVVEAMDEHGKPIVGKTVQFDILAGSGTLSAQTATTNAQGKAQVTLTLGRASGINKVKASSEGIRSWVLFTAVATE